MNEEANEILPPPGLMVIVDHSGRGVFVSEELLDSDPADTWQVIRRLLPPSDAL